MCTTNCINRIHKWISVCKFLDNAVKVGIFWMIINIFYYIFFFIYYAYELKDVYEPVPTETTYITPCSFMSFFSPTSGPYYISSDECVAFNMCYWHLLSDSHSSSSPCNKKDTCLNTLSCVNHITSNKQETRIFTMIGSLPGIFIILYLNDIWKRTNIITEKYKNTPKRYLYVLREFPYITITWKINDNGNYIWWRCIKSTLALIYGLLNMAIFVITFISISSHWCYIKETGSCTVKYTIWINFVLACFRAFRWIRSIQYTYNRKFSNHVYDDIHLC